MKGNWLPAAAGRGFLISLVATLGVLVLAVRAQEFKIITLDPGHFHAALFQREMLPGVADTVFVYAPLGPDLTAHLNRISQFNQRRENPTRWKLEIIASADFFERMLVERRGNIVILSGNNQHKIDRLEASVRAGLHVLADKPWIIEPEAWPKLQTALEAAERSNVIAYDAMTERFEISCALQRALVNDRAVFGEILTGTLAEPAVFMRSVHYLLKEVAGVATLRPVWFFDIRQQGEGLADVGTHLVEHAQWSLFPNQPIDYKRDIEILRGSRWPTVLSGEQFQQVTGANAFPGFLQPALNSNRLEYYCNNSVSYTLRGIHVMLDVQWEFVAPPGGKDTLLTVFRGSKARVELRRDRDTQFQPEVFVIPRSPSEISSVGVALRRTIAVLQKNHPGLGLEEEAGEWRVVIPDALRASHEAHFSEVSRRFLDYARHPQSLPSWEKPNLLAKYYVTTRGVALARQSASRPSLH
jgi:predicted dehydrogenase